MNTKTKSRDIVIWIICIVLGIAMPCRAGGIHSGKKPQWLSKGEVSINHKRSNDTYYFKIVQSVGSDLQQLRQASVNNLADYIGKKNQISGLSVTEITNQGTGSDAHSDTHFNMLFKNEFSSDVFYASLVDEYWERSSGKGDVSEYNYYALFAVSSDGSHQPSFDRFEITRNYGAGPAFMSIIPGVGQLYKGQRLKGGLMLGGAAVGTGAIILCESRRSYYQTRILEQPKFAREYHSKSDNWATGRNIAIGATAALMVWSVVDAAVAPGMTRIKVSPNTSLAFHPSAIIDHGDLAFGTTITVSF